MGRPNRHKGAARIGVWSAALVLVGGAAVATGAIPGADDSVDVCIANAERTSRTGLLGPNVTLDRRGALRAVDTEGGQDCAGDEQPLALNVKGPKGDPGPPGPVDVFTDQTGPNEYIAITDAGDGHVVVAEDVPEGRYVIEASLFFSNPQFFDQDEEGVCVLFADDSALRGTGGLVLPQGAPLSLALDAAADLEGPTTLSVRCTPFAGDDLEAYSASLIATRVDSIH